MKIVYLPVDSRPCNSQFPIQLLKMCGLNCVVPDLDVLDYFRHPSDYSVIKEFLLQETVDADVLILSVDQLAYGSLLASRELHLTMAEALERLKLVEALKCANSSLEIVAFGVIMRSSISTLSKNDVVWHHLMTEYSQTSHRAHISNLIDDEKELAHIKSKLPREILLKYHQVRHRNHEINRASVDLTRAGLFSRLLLLQEDSQSLGFHKLEQEALKKQISEAGLGQKVTLHNGTDEGGCLCAASLLPVPLKLYVETLGRPSCDFIAKYEDRPFDQNIISSCNFGGIQLSTLDEADKVLLVLAPDREPQIDALYQHASHTADDDLRDEQITDRIVDLLHQGKQVGLLDVRYANGGALHFMNMLASKCNIMSLSAYAAWNTASNSLGTILAQLKLGKSGKSNDLFTLERLLDDLIYQSMVRRQLQEELQSYGEDTFNLRDKERGEECLTRLMNATLRETMLFGGREVRAKYTLPWPRTFEVGVAAEGLDDGNGGAG